MAFYDLIGGAFVGRIVLYLSKCRVKQRLKQWEVCFCMPIWYAVSLCSEDVECNKFRMLSYKLSSQVMMSMTKKLKCLKVFQIWECTDTTSVLRVHTHYTLHMTLLIIFIFTSFLANSLSNFFLVILLLHKMHSIIIRLPYLHRTIRDFFEGCTNFHYHIYQVNHDN